MSHSSSVPMNKTEAPLTRQELEWLIRQTLAKRLKKSVNDISLETLFEELEVDSLDLAELFFLLEDELSTTIPLQQGVQLKSIRDVADLVVQHLPCLKDQSSAKRLSMQN